jgi:hypothetical protein
MCALSPDCIFVHGGEHFRARQNKSAGSLVCISHNQVSTWYQVPENIEELVF